MRSFSYLKAREQLLRQAIARAILISDVGLRARLEHELALIEGLLGELQQLAGGA